MFNRDHTRQATLREEIKLTGTGVHSGSPVSVTLTPADPGTGVVFYRNDFAATSDAEIRAHYALVCATELCTVLGDLTGPSVATVEHLLASLSACGVDNVIIETDGGEIPIMDGSSAAFVDAIEAVGLRQQSVRRRFLKIKKPIRVESGESFGEIVPHDGFRIDVEIDFPTPIIGRQRCVLDVTAETFKSELSRARTFGFMSDVEKLWGAGYALGASLDNTVVLGEDRVVNPEGTRYADEFVRHKALDAVGDLSLAGAPILGAYRSYRGGHKLNVSMLRALFNDQEAWSLVEFPVVENVAARQGASGGLAAAAFGPDRF